MKDVQLNTRIPESLKRALDHYAELKGMSLTDTVLFLLETGLIGSSSDAVILNCANVRAKLVELGHAIATRGGDTGATQFQTFKAAAAGDGDMAYLYLGALMTVNLAPDVLDGSLVQSASGHSWLESYLAGMKGQFRQAGNA